MFLNQGRSIKDLEQRLVDSVKMCESGQHVNMWRKVCRYQRGNQKSYFEKVQTTQWLKEKVTMTNNDLQKK